MNLCAASRRFIQIDTFGGCASSDESAMNYNLGRAWLVLGQALAVSARGDEARRAFDTARRHLEATVGPDHAEARETRAALAALDGR